MSDIMELEEGGMINVSNIAYVWPNTDNEFTKGYSHKIFFVGSRDEFDYLLITPKDALRILTGK